jgi:transposase-like protein
MEEKKKRNNFSKGFKQAVIEEYLRTGESKEVVQLRYGIKGNSSIQKWMKILGYSEGYQKPINLGSLTENNVPKKVPVKIPDTLSLEAKIRLLEKQLEDERLRSEMLNRMVDLAEKTYKIPVRKNFDTK